jgi:hypothetical protein
VTDEIVESLRPTLTELAARLGVSIGATVQPQLILHAGNWTGDMFGVGAALILNPGHHVVILKDNKPRDQTAMLKDFYEKTVVNPQHVHVLNVEDAPKAHTQFTSRTDKKALPFEKIVPAIPPGLQESQFQQPVSKGTASTAGVWNANARKKIRKSWGLDGSTDTKVALFLKGRSVQPGSFIILWSRFSGKKGGPHAQHDTSFVGLRQLIKLVPDNFSVIIAGDRPVKRDKLFPSGPAIYNLTEFWKEGDWQKLFPKSDRLTQLAVYDYLHRNGVIKHLGFRSGNLEAYALMGHEVRYMEEEGNIQSGRMESWHTSVNQKSPIGYERIKVKSVPSMTGKWVTEHTTKDDEPKPPWLETPATSTKEQAIGTPKSKWAGMRGFEPGDLEQIRDYFAAVRPAKSKEAQERKDGDDDEDLKQRAKTATRSSGSPAANSRGRGDAAESSAMSQSELDALYRSIEDLLRKPETKPQGIDELANALDRLSKLVAELEPDPDERALFVDPFHFHEPSTLYLQKRGANVAAFSNVQDVRPAECAWQGLSLSPCSASTTDGALARTGAGRNRSSGVWGPPTGTTSRSSRR